MSDVSKLCGKRLDIHPFDISEMRLMFLSDMRLRTCG
jgi:hypothetical protein